MPTVIGALWAINLLLLGSGIRPEALASGVAGASVVVEPPRPTETAATSAPVTQPHLVTVLNQTTQNLFLQVADGPASVLAPGVGQSLKMPATPPPWPAALCTVAEQGASSVIEWITPGEVIVVGSVWEVMKALDQDSPQPTANLQAAQTRQVPDDAKAILQSQLERHERSPLNSKHILRHSDLLVGEDINGRTITSVLPIISVTGSERWFTDSLGLRFRYVEPGTFSPGQQRPNTPRTSVTISRPYLVSLTELTRGQAHRLDPAKYPKPQSPELPQADITWQEAADLARAAAENGGLNYQLPTEAQWEFFARAGKQRPFSIDGDIERIAWHFLNTGGNPQAVATKAPDDWGLFDVHGNVREWCRTWFTNVPMSGVNPQGPTRSSDRVRRGGSFQIAKGLVRSGTRDGAPAHMKFDDLGLRLIIQPPEENKAEPVR
jgi:hypothetical protein